MYTNENKNRLMVLQLFWWLFSLFSRSIRCTVWTWWGHRMRITSSVSLPTVRCARGASTCCHSHRYDFMYQGSVTLNECASDQLKAMSLSLLRQYQRTTIKVYLHWTKANAKAKFFFYLCRCSIWTVNLILYEPIWKLCRFRFCANTN